MHEELSLCSRIARTTIALEPPWSAALDILAFVGLHGSMESLRLAGNRVPWGKEKPRLVKRFRTVLGAGAVSEREKFMSDSMFSCPPKLEVLGTDRTRGGPRNRTVGQQSRVAHFNMSAPNNVTAYLGIQRVHFYH